MGKNVKELLDLAGYSEEEQIKLMNTVAATVVAESAKRFEAALPDAVQAELDGFTEKEKVNEAVILAERHLGLEAMKQIELQTRQDVIDAFALEHIVPRLPKA